MQLYGVPTINIHKIFSESELKRFTEKSDFLAAIILLANWILIAAAFTLAGLWPSFFTILLSTMLLAGRQLGLSILMHECGHNILFKRRSLNAFFGHWFISAPLFLDMNSYAKGHFVHHRYAGTEKDPDLNNYRNYPIDRKSLLRKFWRDLSGQTGFRLIAAARKNQGNVMISPTREPDTVISRANNTIRDGLIVNACLLVLLTISGAPWLYLLWVGAYFTFYMLFLRIRQIAEHGAVPDLFDLDPRQNTRTTYANIIERLLVAPNRVNYHLEHHLLASVPIYHLKDFHHHLLQQGIYKNTDIAASYFSVLKNVTYR